MKSDTLTKLTECVQEISLLEKTVKKLELTKNELRGQYDSIEAKVVAKTKELKEVYTKIEELEKKASDLEKRELSIKEDEEIIEREKSAFDIRKAKLDKWEQELKTKMERVQRILN